MRDPRRGSSYRKLRHAEIWNFISLKVNLIEFYDTPPLHWAGVSEYRSGWQVEDLFEDSTFCTVPANALLSPAFGVCCCAVSPRATLAKLLSACVANEAFNEQFKMPKGISFSTQHNPR